MGPQLQFIDVQHKQSLPIIFFKSLLNNFPDGKYLFNSLPLRYNLGGLNGYHYQPFVTESYSVESQFGIYYEMYPVIVDE